MKTADYSTALDRTAVYTEHPLGTDQAFTREGFLLCRNVPICRIGMQEYLNDEIADSEHDAEGKENPLWGARGKNGIVQVDRPAEEVFRPETIASFEGKDVVDDHPDDAVNPDNYEQHTVGTVLNPRRGEGGLTDFVIADLLVKKASAIAAVRAGKREVSAGYDADYRVIGPGKAQQYNIIANHVALVDRGRCGFRCAIGDKEMAEKAKKQTNDTEARGLLRRMLDAIKSKDRKALDAAMAEMEKEGDEASEKETMEPTGTHIHLHLGGEEEAKGKSPAEAGAADEEEAEGEEENKAQSNTDKRLTALESGIHELADSMRKFMSRAGDADPDEEEEEAEGDAAAEEGEEEAEGDDPEADEAEAQEEPKEKGKDKSKGKDKKKGKDVGMTGKKSLLGGKTVDKAVKDSSGLKDEFAEVKSDAEILAPGLKMPTFDSKAPAKLTQDGLCLLKRRALAAATRDEKNGGKEAVATMLGKKPLAGLDCAVVDSVFTGAVALMQDRNAQDDSPRTISEARGVKRATSDKKAPTSVAELNAANRAHFNQTAK